MRAAVYRRYGGPEAIRVEEVERPIPKPGEVLIKVVASSVVAADWRLRKADPFLTRMVTGLVRPRRPMIPGMEFAGVVEALGEGVSRFSPGDAVFGTRSFEFGANAEYLSHVEVGAIARAPAGLPLEESAATMFGGVSALDFLQRAGTKAGQKVLVYGASGSVGTAAVQLAKHLGASVTGVCSTPNLELVRQLGADAVIDYTRDDFTASGPAYDVVFDTVGKAGVRRSLAAVKPGGALISFSLAMMAGAGLWGHLAGKRVIGGVAQTAPDHAETFRQLIEAGAYRPVIDRRYPLSDIAAAHAYAESFRKRGNVLVLMN